MRVLTLVLILGTLGGCSETPISGTDRDAAPASSDQASSIAPVPTEQDLQRLLASSPKERVQIAKFGGGVDDVSLEHHVRNTSCKPARIESKGGALCRLQFVWLPVGASRAKIVSTNDGLWAWTHMLVIKDGLEWRSASKKTA